MEPVAIGRDSIRTQLERILASPEFVNAGRLSRFLRFTVEKTAAGQGDQLKEYLIGVEVFDRGDSYDPRIDCIVRVEAGRLRAKLQHYYQNGGSGDPVLVTLPKGSYVPAVTWRHAPAAEPAAPRSAKRFERGVQVAAASAALILAIAGWYLLRQREAGRPDPGSVAILPFKSITGEPGTGRFADGLTEDITTALAKIEGVRVVGNPMSSTFESAGRSGGRAPAGAFLEGSVRRERGRIRVTVNLIESPGGHHFWSEVYERDIRNDVALEYDLAGVIAQTAAIRLGRHAAAPLRGPTGNARALDAYLEGLERFSTGTPQGLEDAIRLLDRAAALDPAFAGAYTAAAKARLSLADYAGRPAQTLAAEAENAARRALSLDPRSPDAHFALSRALFGKWQFSEALREVSQALALDPDNCPARRFSVQCLTVLRRFDEAGRESQRSESCVLFSLHRASLALLYHRLRRYDAAMEAASEAAALDPGDGQARRIIGRVYEHRRMYPEAIAALREAIAARGKESTGLGALGYVYAISGKPQEAARILEELRERPAGRFYYSAVVYAGLGETEHALDQLEASYQERERAFPYAHIDERFDTLHHHPRYRALIGHLNLED